MNLDEALIHARELRFSDKSDEDLRQMLISCGNRTGHAGDVYTASQIPHAVKMIQEEQARRLSAKHHKEAIAEQQRLNNQTTGQLVELHKETKSDLGEIKTLVGNLAKPRRIDRAILIVGIIAAIAGVIAAIAAVVAIFLGH